jgi:alpha-N-arabinofuranosidase
MKKIFFCSLIYLFIVFELAAQSNEIQITIDASNLKYKINKNIYGQFSEHLGNCIYGGIWVGKNSTIPNIDGIRKDVVDALKKIEVPVLRWPGGCFADEYHWKDGIGQTSERPKMINTNWGGVTEDNSFGTHEFLEFCSLIGCEPYFTGNIGSGTVQELSQWVEYVNSDNVSPMTDLRKKNGRYKSWGVKFWGLGNESWGCGGNMSPEFYADVVRRYGSFCKDFGSSKVFKIASGPNDDDYNWTDVLMKNAGKYFDGISLHHYSFSNGKTAADFDEAGWFDIMNKTLDLDKLISNHSVIMDKYDHFKRVALIVDEWGTWFKVEPGTNPGFLFQQNTMRDAVAAACNLNIFNNHCDRVRMANIAQMVNVLQAMILTKDNEIVLTPTYYVFDLFKVHQDAMLVPVKIYSRVSSASKGNYGIYSFGSQNLPAVNCSASIDAAGRMHVSLCNINPHSSEKIKCDLIKFKACKLTGNILTAGKMNACNTFSNPKNITPKSFSDFKLLDNNIDVNIPPMSVVVLELTGAVEMSAVVDLKNPLMGINYQYYEGNWVMLPDFDKLTPKTKGVEDNFILPNENSGVNFGVKYNGYLKIPKDGIYTFYLNSDDGSILSIDNKIIINNDGVHAPVESSGIVVLKEGFHPVEISYFQQGGGMALDVSIEGQGLSKQAIPGKMLYRKN